LHEQGVAKVAVLVTPESSLPDESRRTRIIEVSQSFPSWPSWLMGLC